MSLEMITAEVKNLGTAWEDFKKQNDIRLKQIEEKGAADPITVEQVNKLNQSLDEHKSRMDSLETALARGNNADVNGKGSPEDAEYKTAFLGYARKGQVSPILEQKTLSVGDQPNGGYLVTPAMSAVIQKRVFESSPLRQLAAVESITSDSLDFHIDVDEAAASWTSEQGTVSETNTPTLAMGNIPTHEMYAEPRATQKLLDDAGINIEAWLAEKIADKFARSEATAFISGQIEQVNSGTAGSVTADGLINLQGALKEPYQAGASFLMLRAVATTIRLLKDGEGRYLWSPGLSTSEPDSLLAKPVYYAADMPVAASASLSIAYGDFRAGYKIVDRIGIRTLRDPFTAKPYVKFYSTKRVGGAVVNFEAIKLQKLSA